MDKEKFKKSAAEKAVEEIKSGMILGLGTGSTVYYALKKIGELIVDRKLTGIKGVPSSIQTEKLAVEFGIPLTTFEERAKIDLTIDGADEVDANLNLIKGGGGALLREKIIAQNSSRLMIITDESKISETLGSKWHVPIEVIPFAAPVEKEFLESLGAAVKIRQTKDGDEFRTDQNNLIIDADFGPIHFLRSLAQKLDSRAGIVEHGLFIDLADEVITAGEDGIKILKKIY